MNIASTDSLFTVAKLDTKFYVVLTNNDSLSFSTKLIFLRFTNTFLYLQYFSSFTSFIIQTRILCDLMY